MSHSSALIGCTCKWGQGVGWRLLSKDTKQQRPKTVRQLETEVQICTEPFPASALSATPQILHAAHRMVTTQMMKVEAEGWSAVMKARFIPPLDRLLHTNHWDVFLGVMILKLLLYHQRM